MGRMSVVWWFLCTCVLSHEHVSGECVDLNVVEEPNIESKAAVARWVMHQANYGTLSTISHGFRGFPFGNIASFADGMKNASTGHIYFKCSFTVSGQDIPGQYCSNRNVDPQDPRCPRITLLGTLMRLNPLTSQQKQAEAALYERHPAMKTWNQTNHHWTFYQLDIESIWLIDFFGGPTLLSPAEYYAVQPCDVSRSSLRASAETLTSLKPHESSSNHIFLFFCAIMSVLGIAGMVMMNVASTRSQHRYYCPLPEGG